MCIISDLVNLLISNQLTNDDLVSIGFCLRQLNIHQEWTHICKSLHVSVEKEHMMWVYFTNQRTCFSQPKHMLHYMCRKLDEKMYHRLLLRHNRPELIDVVLQPSVENIAKWILNMYKYQYRFQTVWLKYNNDTWIYMDPPKLCVEWSGILIVELFKLCIEYETCDIVEHMNVHQQHKSQIIQIVHNIRKTKLIPHVMCLLQQILV